jgi:hypothetical protein
LVKGTSTLGEPFYVSHHYDEELQTSRHGKKNENESGASSCLGVVGEFSPNEHRFEPRETQNGIENDVFSRFGAPVTSPRQKNQHEWPGAGSQTGVSGRRTRRKAEEEPPAKYACPEPVSPPPDFSANRRTRKTSRAQAFVVVTHLEDYKSLDV